MLFDSLFHSLYSYIKFKILFTIFFPLSFSTASPFLALESLFWSVLRLVRLVTPALGLCRPLEPRTGNLGLLVKFVHFPPLS